MDVLKEKETNENLFEYIEFRVGNGTYGISIQNVREIIQPLPVTALPHAHPVVEGIIQLRGEVLPVINLKKLMGQLDDTITEDAKYIVAELAEKTVVMHVSAVTQIERCYANEIEAVADIYQANELPVTGVIKRERDMVLFIDFQKVLAELG